MPTNFSIKAYWSRPGQQTTLELSAAVSERGCKLVPLIAASIGNFGMKRGNLLSLLLLVRTARFLLGQTALFSTQPLRLQGWFMIAGLIGREVFQAKIESNDWLVVGENFNVRQLRAGNEVPPPALTLERDCSGCGLDFSVQVNPNQFAAGAPGAAALALFPASVGAEAVRLKSSLQLPSQVDVGLEAEFVGAEHLFAHLVSGDVPFQAKHCADALIHGNLPQTDTCFNFNLNGGTTLTRHSLRRLIYGT